MASVRRSAGPALAAALFAAGCCGSGPGSQQARDENRKMDTLTRLGQELERDAAARPVLVARSQAPTVLTPVRLGTPVAPAAPIPPAPPVPAPAGAAAPAGDIRLPDLTPAAGTAPTTPPVSTAVATEPIPAASPPADAPAPLRLAGDAQVRIVASIGNNPIYESEVREAVYQRSFDFVRLAGAQRAAREREVFREELRKIIEREMVLDEMAAQMGKNKQGAMLGKLKEAAGKEADARLREVKKEHGIPSDEDFKTALRAQGLTLSGIRRQIERTFMMQTFLRQKLEPYLEKVGLAELREYYAAHPDEFKSEDKVKWQDLFVLAERFNSRAEAKQYADHMAARAARGEDFAKLAGEYSMGDSKFRNGAGVGEKPGEVFPQDLEPTVLALKQGQVTVRETETGYHVVRVAERAYAGVKPYDDKLQADIRRRLQNQIYEREVRRYTDTLWKRIQPQIWAE